MTRGRFLEITMPLSSLRSAVARTRVSLGVDVGANSVRIVSITRRRGKRAVRDGWSTVLPLSVRTNPEERRSFSRQALREYLARARIPFLSEISLAVSGPEVIGFTLLTPRGSEAELREAVKGELGRRLPYPLEEASWDYFLSPEASDLEAGQVALLVIAAPTPWIQQWISLCRSLRLIPTLVTAVPSALHYLLWESGLLKGRQGIATLEIGSAASIVTFTYKGHPEFLRLIHVGVDHLVRGLMRTVTTAMGEHTITAAEAENILQTYGIETEERVLPIAGLTSGQVYAMVRPTLEYLYLEVQRTLTYCRQALQRPVVERLYVSGEGSLIPHLVEFLNANMDESTVESLNPLAVLQGWGHPPSQVRETLGPTASAYAVAIGAACSATEQALGPLPAFHRHNYRLEWTQLVSRWVASLSLVVLLALTVGIRLQWVRYRRLVQQTQAQVAELESRVRRIQESQRLKSLLAQRETLIAQAVSRQPLWIGIFKELSRISPEGIRLISLETMEGTLPLRIRMEGEILSAYTSVEVLYAQFQFALEESPFFTDIQLMGMKKDLYSPVARATFELTCRLVY